MHFGGRQRTRNRPKGERGPAGVGAWYRAARQRGRCPYPIRALAARPIASAGRGAPLPPSWTRRDARSRSGRVWIVNQYATPPDEPSGATTSWPVGSWRAATRSRSSLQGWGTATASTDSPAAWRTGAGPFDGVRFVWLRTFPYRGNNWRRQVNMLSFLVMFLVVQARLPRPDFVIGSTVHPFAALGGWIAARLRGARFAFEIRDLWPQTLVDLGAMRVGSPGERLLRILEAFLVRRASTVITLLPGVRDYLAEQGLPNGHVVYLPNGADLAAFARRGEGTPADLTPTARAAIDAVEELRARRPLRPRLRRRVRARQPGRPRRRGRGDHREECARPHRHRHHRRRAGACCGRAGSEHCPRCGPCYGTGAEARRAGRPASPGRCGGPHDLHPGLPLRDQLQQALRVHGSGASRRLCDEHGLRSGRGIRRGDHRRTGQSRTPRRCVPPACGDARPRRGLRWAPPAGRTWSASTTSTTSARFSPRSSRRNPGVVERPAGGAGQEAVERPDDPSTATGASAGAGSSAVNPLR